MRRVPSVGPRTATIALVGEAPGREEELRLKPFVGQSGHLLDRALVLAKINRDDCYITNVVKIRPSNNDFSKVTNLSDWYEELRRELEEVNPNIVIALGDKAIYALTGNSGSTKWRGSVVSSSLVCGLKVICCEHPAFLLPHRNPKDFHLLVFDLQRALKESETKTITTFKKEMIVKPSFDEVIYHLEESLRRPNVVIDVESNRKTKSLLCLGISYQDNHAFCIPFRAGHSNCWSLEEETAIWMLIQRVLTDESVCKIGQNIQFDMTILYRHVGEIYPVSFDTMLAHHLLHVEDPHNLGHVTSIYTNHPYYKDEGKTWMEKGDVLQFYEYNCTDCIVTRAAYEEMHKELVEEKLDRLFYGYVMPLFRVMFQIERFGILIDKDKRDSMAKRERERAKVLQKQINDNIGFELNVNSPKQMQEFLYGYLKLPPERHPKTKRITADKKAIKKLHLRYPNPIFDWVLDLRGRTKALGTYLEAKIDSDGRMRTQFDIRGTDTYRLSSRKGIFGSGMDLQNVPESLRIPFIPDKGKILIEADLSQAENRVVAYLAEEEHQIEIFETGGDFHSIMAGWLNRERKIAKSIVHGTNYGMKKRLLSEITGLSMVEAEVVRQKYFSKCPKIERWQLQIQDQLKKTRTLTTPLGRVRMFTGVYGDEMFRKAYAFTPQSTVADWLNINLVALYYKMKGVADILLQVHDSILVQCKREDEEWVCVMIREMLERPLMIRGRECRIPCGIKRGLNWGELK